MAETARAPDGEEAAAPLVPPELPGHTIERLLGRGGFGAVYLARDQQGSALALKVAAAEAAASHRLHREAVALRMVGTPHVPEFLASGLLPDGRSYLAMELVSLPILSDRLAALSEGMPLAELEARGSALIAAVQAVHRRGIVHRDLKPENVFMGPVEDGRCVARIFDFGLVESLAGLRDRAKAGNEPTNSGEIVGTPEYMAPEQCEPGSECDGRIDIYALGVMLYEMITGRTPFWGNAAEVQQSHLYRRPPRPSELVPTPAPLEEVVLRCLAKDPARRFESVEVLAEKFAGAVARARRAQPADAASATPAATGKPVAKKKSANQRRPMVVLLLQGVSDNGRLKGALAAIGGDLAQVGKTSAVAVFGQKTAENPLRRALRAAESLLGRGFAPRALLDIASVTVQRRPDGGERFVSSAFAKIEKLINDLDANGVYITPAVAQAGVEGRQEALAGREVIRVLAPADDITDSATVMREAAAPLVGRGDSIDQLVAGAAVAVAGKPTIATVVAEAGHGKTHFCAALVRALREKLGEVTIIELRAREPMDGDPDRTLRSLLRRCLDLPQAMPEDQGQALLTEKLGKALWPPAAMALGWLAPDAPPLRALGAAPGVLRAMVVRSAGEALRRLAAQRPLLLLIDDAHYADQATTDAVEYATLAEASAPVWACLLARPAFEEGRPSWAERSAARQRVVLGPLATQAAIELCRQLLLPAENVPANTLESLVSATHGNPLLLTELVRGLKRDGFVRRNPKGGAWFLASDELERLPDLTLSDWLAERELGRLPPDLASHVQLAALLGSEFSEMEIEAVLAELDRDGLATDFPMDARVATRKLLGMGLLILHRRDIIGFRHAMVREAVRSSVSESLRTQVHTAAFRFYRGAAQVMGDSERLPRLAFHAARAGLRDEAAALYLQLAERARSRHAYLEAESLYSQALPLLPESDDRHRMMAWRGRGLMRYRVSRYDAIDDLALAREAARRLGDAQAEVEIVLDESTAFDWTDEYRRSRALVGEAEALAGPLAAAGVVDQHLARLIAARVLLGQGRAMWRFSERKEALEKLTQAVELAEQLGDDGYETLVVSLLLLGDLLPWYNETKRAELAFERVIALCEDHGDRVHVAVALLNRRQIWIAHRDLDRAIDDTLQCIQIARELGLATTTFMGSYNLGEMFYQAGDPVAAWPHVNRAVELENRRFSGVGRPVARLLQARVLAFEGNHDGARSWVAEIRSHQERLSQSGTTDGLLMPSEDVLLTMVDLFTRDATDQEWSELRARADKYSVEQELIEVADVEARWLAHRGRTAEARQKFEEAHRLAEKIPNVMRARLDKGLSALPPADSAPLRAVSNG